MPIEHSKAYLEHIARKAAWKPAAEKPKAHKKHASKGAGFKLGHPKSMGRMGSTGNLKGADKHMGRADTLFGRLI